MRPKLVATLVVFSVTLACLAGIAMAADAIVTVTTETAVASEEGPSPGIFKFTRTGDTSQPLVVNFTLSGTASRSDYLIWENSADFGAGADTTRVTVLPVNDSLQEGNEVVKLTLVPGTGYVAGASNNASVTIRDKFISGRVGVFDPREVDSTTGRVLVDPDIAYLDAWIANDLLNIRMDLYYLNLWGFRSFEIFLDTDRNPLTGDYRAGRLAGQEYRVHVLAGLIPGYDVYRLRTAPPDVLTMEDPKQDGYVASGPLKQSGNTIQLAVPLGVIGAPSSADLFAMSYVGDYPVNPGSGDRAPNYGAFNTATRKVVVRNPGKTQLVRRTDPTGDSTGEFDLVAAEYATIGDQFSIKLTFNQAFDPSNPSLHYGALDGEVNLDSDRNLLTGAFFMGQKIPTWGGDVSLRYHVGSYWNPVAQFMVFTDTLGNWVSFGQESNDGRWTTASKTLTMTGSLSIFDAFTRVVEPPGRTPTRISTKGTMLAQARTFGYDLFSTADALPGSISVLNTSTGIVEAPYAWDTEKVISVADPVDHGGIAGNDLIRVDAQVIEDKLVIKATLSAWINTDDDNLFEVLLDTDMNVSTGHPWANTENGGLAIGADYVLEVGSLSLGYGMPSVYLAELVRPDGVETRHEALLLAQPASSFTQPGSFTVTIPLAALGITNPFSLRFYVTSSRPAEEVWRIDTAPPSPMVIEGTL